MPPRWQVVFSVAVALVCLAIPPQLLMQATQSVSTLSSSVWSNLFPSTMAIKNVAVAGGTGNLGTHIVSELVKAGFTVTLLTRSAGTATPPGVAAVKVVDYTSVDNLTTALAGQDAVVSVLASPAVGGQTPLVDAAVAAGVQRFLPSEFGINTRKARGTPIGKILAGKVATVDYLIEKANASGGTFAWTGIATGLFFDWGLARGLLGVDGKAKTATVYDSGNEPFQTSNLDYIGRTVAAVLQQAGTPADKTANQYIETASFTPTQNELLAAAEKATGGSKYAVTQAKTADLQKSGEDKLAKGDFSAFVDLLRVWQFQDGAKHAPDAATSGNALLGLPLEDLDTVVKEWAAKL